MNTTLTRTRKTEEGSSLFLVMTLIVIAFLMLASALSWSQNNALTIARNNQYWRTIAAAEAATEKVYARLHDDFQLNGETTVYNNSQGTAYYTTVPTAADSGYWSSYVFSDGQGRNNQTYVALVPGTRTNWTVLNTQYAGLSAIADTYQIKSYARDSQARFNLSAGVQQNIQPSSIPVFQDAIFYNVDLEIEPGPNMTVTGRVHSNGNIYQVPGATLTYQSDVTSSGVITNADMPGDPNVSVSPGTVVYRGAHTSKTPTLTLPIAGGNDPTTAYEIIKPPPVGGDTDPALAGERYYNKADILITVTDGLITAKSGSLNLFATPIVNLPAGTVTSYTNRFYNGRELKGVNVIDIDVNKFKTWADDSSVVTGSGNLLALYGREPNSIYVLDQRNLPAGTEKGVRLINGAQLPNGGLTVATQDPLYVKGDFNIKDSTGTSSGSDTTHTKPASLAGDAITVLSSAFDDTKNTSSLGNLKSAAGTTVNAAFLAGIVKTTPSSYSSKTLTYNGSMVVLFYSQIATGLWNGTGIYYNAPLRNWTFDNNFMNPMKLPPGTPTFRFVLRSDWFTLGKDPTS